MLFFVLSGARLDVSLIPAIGAVGALYIIMRVVESYGFRLVLSSRLLNR